LTAATIKENVMKHNEEHDLMAVMLLMLFNDLHRLDFLSRHAFLAFGFALGFIL